MMRVRSQAFTLIETIIAMSLLSLLMAIVWTMFGIYTKLEAKGVARAEEAGLVRALDRQFRSDLLHVVGIDPLQPITVERGENAQPSRWPVNGYLVGTTTELHFVVSPPEAPGVGHFTRVISYQPRTMAEDPTAGPDSLQPGQSESAPDFDQRLEFAVPDESATPLGIDRRDHSWSRYWQVRERTESTDDLTSSSRPVILDSDDFLEVGAPQSDDDTESAQLLETKETKDEIPEVARLRFRYSDGVSWSDRWDSTASGRLPMAIEIGFDLQMVEPQRGRQRAADGRAADQTTVSPQSSRPKIGSERGTVALNRETISVGAPDETQAVAHSEYRLVVSLPAAKLPRDRDQEMNQDPSEDPSGPGELRPSESVSGEP